MNTADSQQDYGPSYTRGDVVLSVFRSAPDGLLLLLLLFWGLVHCWAMAWCELMRFADRHYYNVMYFEWRARIDTCVGLVELYSHVELLS